MVPGFPRVLLRTLYPILSGLILLTASIDAATAAQSSWTDTIKALFGGSSEDAGIEQPAVDMARTRFIIGLDKPTEFQVFSLSSPNRVVVDLRSDRFKLPDANASGPVGLVKSFHGGVTGKGTSKIIINVASPVVVHSAKVQTSDDGSGHRLALEIMPVPGSKVAASKPKARKPLAQERFSLGAAAIVAQPPLPKPALHPDERAKTSFKPVIVIDPGHGGHDSGAKKHGTIEKDVVLAFARVFRDNLEATGRYKVLMTRDTDVFVTLDERRAYAERNNANLFIAVHADYAKSKASGATIYSLRDSVAKRLKSKAKRSVSKSLLSTNERSKVLRASGNVGTVHTILADLARREVDATRDRTKMFSRSVVQYMGTSTDLRNDPHKTAAFRVLKTAQFPSVLIELAYITNKRDAARLKSDSWRSKVSTSIVSAVDKYFSAPGARVPM